MTHAINAEWTYGIHYFSYHLFLYCLFYRQRSLHSPLWIGGEQCWAHPKAQQRADWWLSSPWKAMQVRKAMQVSHALLFLFSLPWKAEQVKAEQVKAEQFKAEQDSLFNNYTSLRNTCISCARLLCAGIAENLWTSRHSFKIKEHEKSFIADVGIHSCSKRCIGCKCI